MTSGWPPVDTGGGSKNDAGKDSASGRLGRGLGVEGGAGPAIERKLAGPRRKDQGDGLAVDGHEVDGRMGAVGRGRGPSLVARRLVLGRGLVVAVALEVAGMPFERPGGLGAQDRKSQEPEK